MAFYCAQIDTVMHIAKIADVKFEDINAGDAKIDDIDYFQCIHQNLRVVYVGQQDPLANGHTLWTTLELRFQTVDQVARRKEYRPQLLLKGLNVSCGPSFSSFQLLDTRLTVCQQCSRV